MTMILLADDSADFRATIALALEIEGFEVAQVENGTKCLAFIQQFPEPLLVILDNLMPEIYGKDVLQILAKEYPSHARFVVLFLSASSLPDAQFQDVIVNLPFHVEIVRKPFELDEFLDTVQLLMNTYLST